MGVSGRREIPIHRPPEREDLLGKDKYNIKFSIEKMNKVMRQKFSIWLMVIILSFILVDILPDNVAGENYSKPDLQVNSMTFKDPDIRIIKGDKATLCVCISNVGNRTLTEPWTLVVICNSKEIFNESLQIIIKPDEKIYYNFTTRIPEDNLQELLLTVILDPEDNIDELMNENNMLIILMGYHSPQKPHYWLFVFIIAFVIAINLGIVSYVFLRYLKERRDK